MKGKKGILTIYVSFIFIAIVIILIGAFAAPIGTRISSALFVAGEDILRQSNESISEISNATIRGNVNDLISGAMDNGQTNIEVSTAMFKYSWLLLLGLGGLIIFLITRRVVEFQQGGIA